MVLNTGCAMNLLGSTQMSGPSPKPEKQKLSGKEPHPTDLETTGLPLPAVPGCQVRGRFNGPEHLLSWAAGQLGKDRVAKEHSLLFSDKSK
jgi:hypothetical protein